MSLRWLENVFFFSLFFFLLFWLVFVTKELFKGALKVANTGIGFECLHAMQSQVLSSTPSTMLAEVTAKVFGRDTVDSPATHIMFNLEDVFSWTPQLICKAFSICVLESITLLNFIDQSWHFHNETKDKVMCRCWWQYSEKTFRNTQRPNHC